MQLMGVSRFITCAAEVPFFHFSQQLIDRVGVNGVLAMACVCYVLRFLYYAHLTTPWAVLPAELLHGVTFAAMWAASVSKAHQLAPEGMGATAQVPSLTTQPHPGSRRTSWHRRAWAPPHRCHH